jgi:hypothetical protein
LVLGLGLILSYPWTVGARPSDVADRAAVAAYLTRLFIFFCVAVVVFLGAAISAALIIRRVRHEYREMLVSNLADLLSASEARAESQQKEESKDGASSKEDARDS